MWSNYTPGKQLKRGLGAARSTTKGKMVRPVWLLLSGFLLASVSPAADDPVVFRSDVALVRVDAQVLDRNNRAITGLGARDFVLRADGKVQDIRNFSREDMPLDVLFLFDVSGSMRPHVERIAFAAKEALRSLGDQDRVAIMVFDRSTRLRMSFRSSHDDVDRELQSLLRQETFDGGTDITRALYDAASWIGRNGRREARRAIVILTDDQTERGRDEAGVGRALDDAGAVLSLLLAPDAMAGRYGGMGRGRGGYPGGSGGGNGPLGPLGGIILGGGGGGRRGGGYPGGGYPGGGGRRGGGMPSHTESAGTAEIARHSGGDSMPVDDASALETTLERIRQRYALHFYLPSDGKAGQNPRIEVALADTARSRYPDADVRYRRVNMSGTPSSGPYQNAGSTSGRDSDPVVVSSAPVDSTADQGNGSRRRRAVSDSTGPRGPSADGNYSGNTSSSSTPEGGWRRAGDPSMPPPPPPAAAESDPKPADQTDATTKDPDNSKHGGWRKVKPDQP
jgi:VWFA-related protein